MSHVFLSYSRKDHFFAELARMKLEAAGIAVWVDQSVPAGENWHDGIDRGISACHSIVLAMSSESASSPYVTYEWSSAMGKGKPIVPIRLNHCEVHPKLEVIQYLDFSVNEHQPWSSLIDRLKEIAKDRECAEGDLSGEMPDEMNRDDDPLVNSILNYLNLKGYQLASFERIQEQVDDAVTGEQLENLLERNKGVFRSVRIKGGKPGIAKL